MFERGLFPALEPRVGVGEPFPCPIHWQGPSLRQVPPEALPGSPIQSTAKRGGGEGPTLNAGAPLPALEAVGLLKGQGRRGPSPRGVTVSPSLCAGLLEVTGEVSSEPGHEA